MIKRNTLIVCEIGLNANGDIDIAKQLIDVAKNTGCDYVKFQKRDIESCYTKEFLDSPRESPWGKTQREQKVGLEFSLDQYKEIDSYCKEKDIGWFLSPWDLYSIDFIVLNFPDIPYIKIPSAKITDTEFLKRCRASGRDLIMSTGMSDLDMVQKAVSLLRDCDVDHLKYILHCVSTYPCKDTELNLLQIKLLFHYFRTPSCKIGFSNHHPSIIFMPQAVLLGAEMIEVHITLDRTMYGTDQSSSIEPFGLRKLVQYIEGTERAFGSLNKVILESEIPIAKKLRNL